ncbi:uracil-DNA glycosylase family protein [Paenibacillus yanchengensis]|uniref:Uracil-DNA glycosylase family protein n=1 Tax=Paenibacillus yanchengensis TaxID=2035833 RepID=A0ABW4YEU8_9BACL
MIGVKKVDFTELKNGILACRDCESKFGFTPVPIFQGKEHSLIMQIGQAPSRTVHRTNKPFNDLSGEKLKYQWYQITDDVFYNEDNFYMASMAHCFPGKNSKGGDNPPPMACARKWLRTEIEMVHNELYIIIGAKAAKFLFPDEKFSELVKKTTVLNNKPAIVLPHPSPANIRWFTANPSFEKTRVPEIKDIVHRVLQLS